MKTRKTELMAMLAIAALAPPAYADWVQDLAAASTERHYVLPTAAEVERAQALFLRLMRGERGATLGKAWSELGFDLISDATQGLTWLQEQSTARHGRGFFIFRQGGASALQMPHAFKDAMTGQIGVTLFRQGRYSAAAWNTVPRDFVVDGRRIDADMAHLDDSYFIAFARAFAQRHPQGRVYQLHGFEQESRRSGAARGAAVILSDGTRTPASTLRRLADCIAGQARASVLTYPEDVRELGATTNTVAAALRREGFAGFVHVEMSHRFRSNLSQSPALQKTLLICMGGVD